MKRLRYAKWYLPNDNPRGKPYLSRWRMTDEDAAQRKAVRIDESSIEWRDIPETPEEKAEAFRRTDGAFKYNKGDPLIWQQGRRISGPPVTSEADHFEVCPDCGQAFDKRELRQVMHHMAAGHEPIPIDS